MLGCGKVREKVWEHVREVWKSVLGCGGDQGRGVGKWGEVERGVGKCVGV